MNWFKRREQKIKINKAKITWVKVNLKKKKNVNQRENRKCNFGYIIK